MTMKKSVKDALEHLESILKYEYSSNRLSAGGAEDIREAINELGTSTSVILKRLGALTGLQLGLKRLLNSRVDINRLPPEILTAILLNVSSDAERTCELNRQLALVCKQWHDVVVSDPNFWTTLRSDEPNLAGMVISKSKGLAISIVSTESDYIFGTSDVEFFAIASAVMSRCWQFVHIGPSYQEMLQCLKMPTPLLTSLHVMNTTPVSISTDLALQPDGPPLRTVDIHNINLPWNSLRLSGLTSLKISYIEEPIPSRLALSKILQSSPQLEHLAFTAWYSTNKETDDAPHIDSLMLPRLRALELSMLPEVTVEFLLGHIKAPACGSFVLSGLDASQLGNLPALVQSATTSKDNAVVVYKKRGATCRVHRSTPAKLSQGQIDQRHCNQGLHVTVELGLTPDNLWYQLGSSLRTLLEPLPEVRLIFESPSNSIRFENLSVPETDLPPITLTSSLPFITHVEIQNRYDSVIPLLEYLSSPQWDEALDCFAWPWPRLKELDVVHIDQPSETLFPIFRFMELRYRAFKTVQMGSSVEGVDLNTFVKVRTTHHVAKLLEEWIASANLEDDLRELLLEGIVV